MAGTGEDRKMTDTPWQGDACSLVDAFRAGERSPLEETEASLAAIGESKLNSFSFVDAERARESAKAADVSLPFGGVPTAIKDLFELFPGKPAKKMAYIAGLPKPKGCV